MGITLGIMLFVISVSPFFSPLTVSLFPSLRAPPGEVHTAATKYHTIINKSALIVFCVCRKTREGSGYLCRSFWWEGLCVFCGLGWDQPQDPGSKTHLIDHCLNSKQRLGWPTLGKLAHSKRMTKDGWTDWSWTLRWMCFSRTMSVRVSEVLKKSEEEVPALQHLQLYASHRRAHVLTPA